ncbi:hypothetical protein J3F84DRAFT_392450 [Trichoderma pleuroticola]
MNWMGGNLSRHRRGKGWKEETARQKEYFAKARSRQREGAKSSPVPLSAANFIPNYAPRPQATTSLGEAAFPSSMPTSKPTGAADEAPRGLNDLLEPLRQDVTQLPLFASSENHPMGASNQGNELKEPTRKVVERPSLSRHILDQQHRTFGAHQKSRSKFDRQRDVRERRVIQNTPSSPRSMRIRIGNSIGNPTFGDRSAAESTEPARTMRTTRPGGVNIASCSTGEVFTGFSPPSTSSDVLLSSPCRKRAARRKNVYNSPKKIVGAPSAEFQRPLLDCACGSAKRPSSMSEIESTGSIAVQVGDVEITPEDETDEERAWRQWLG